MHISEVGKIKFYKMKEFKKMNSWINYSEILNTTND